MSFKSKFSKSDLILFDLWVESEDALIAFDKWKIERMSYIKSKNDNFHKGKSKNNKSGYFLSSYNAMWMSEHTV